MILKVQIKQGLNTRSFNMEEDPLLRAGDVWVHEGKKFRVLGVSVETYINEDQIEIIKKTYKLWTKPLD